MPRSAVSCERYARELAVLAGDDARLPAALVQHLDTCLSCQAELARYRRLLRLLSELRLETERLPAGLLSEVIEHLSRAAERRALRDILSRRRSAYLLLGFGVVAVSVPLGLARVRARFGARRVQPRSAE